MSETSRGRRKYRTTNWKAYNAALKARGDLTIWLDKGMQWLAPLSGKRGRSQTFSDAAIQFCLTIKCLFGLPLRQTLGWCSPYSKWQDCPGLRPTTARCAAGKRAWMCECTTAQAATACISMPIPRASNSWAKASGKPRAQPNEAVRACKRLGYAIWERWSGYHRRSLVETKMNCFKRLCEKVMARTFERQVTELNIRASILNQFTELGTPQTVAVA